MKRHKGWNKKKKEFLKKNPRCYWCGMKANTVHHIIPFSVDKTLEMVDSNLMSMCHYKQRNCHLVVGHLCNWKLYNKGVDLLKTCQ